ncbi:uncharacterized membrane protein YheB (UPF0754 family) [Alkalibacillus flavidus]|uniref:Uncharacterized membrane protein YheB (UPF0754 family) n=1 Tax=Alkalibacillus flavidus TaxID=546021 RepID=A0ABV2KY91_9BACI
MTGLLIIMMVAIGALIGGMTNHLAIKMLFKPYRAIYIGRFKLPFTPGLIPKRQAELAEQLGRLVTSHLVTNDALKHKITDESFQQSVIASMQTKYDELKANDHRTIDVLQKVKTDLTVERIDHDVKHKITEQLKNMYDQERTRTISDVLPENVTATIDGTLPKASSYILEQVDQFINSREGQKKLSDAATQFLENQGFLGSMVSNYLGEEGLVEKITPAINQFIRSHDTHETVETMLRAEWHKWQHLELASVRDYLFGDDLEHNVATYIVDELRVKDYLEEPVSTWLTRFETPVKQDVIPNVATLLLNQIADNLDSIMETLDLSQMVEQQVSQFDLHRLEKMVLDISRRELKMITYLGALLGGIIGLVQGIIVIFIG